MERIPTNIITLSSSKKIEAKNFQTSLVKLSRGDKKSFLPIRSSLDDNRVPSSESLGPKNSYELNPNHLWVVKFFPLLCAQLNDINVKNKPIPTLTTSSLGHYFSLLKKGECR